MRARSSRRRWRRWLVIAVVAAVAAVVVGPFVYIHVVEGAAPPPLALGSPSASGSPAGTTTGGGAGTAADDGTWKVAAGSLVGYRVKEVLFGQSTVAVGRTGAITGTVTVRGTAVRAARFTVDMTTVTSDQSRRDDQFNGRIMETATYHTATFTLSRPASFGSVPGDGVDRTFRVTGRLTLHGVTRTVSFGVTGRSTGSAVQIAGSVPIVFADWGIPNPSFGPVTTEDHGTLEFALNLTRA